MNWLNIYTPVLRSPEFIGSEPVARATWLYVFAYCAEQENGGRIIGAKNWKDRQWQQTCGVTIAEVQSSAPLITWQGDDLLLHAYPMNKEAEVQRMRELGRLSTERKADAARKNGASGGRPKENPTEETQDNPTETQRKETQLTQRKPIEGEEEGEDKGKEKKKKGKEEEHTSAQAPGIADENAGHRHNAKILLESLNELTGKAYRPVPAHLDLIIHRLQEPGITPEGVQEMMEAKTKEWKGTDFEKFLRPQTLFQKSKFAGYYDARHVNGTVSPFDTRGRVMQ